MVLLSGKPATKELDVLKRIDITHLLTVKGEDIELSYDVSKFMGALKVNFPTFLTVVPTVYRKCGWALELLRGLKKHGRAEAEFDTGSWHTEWLLVREGEYVWITVFDHDLHYVGGELVPWVREGFGLLSIEDWNKLALTIYSRTPR